MMLEYAVQIWCFLGLLFFSNDKNDICSEYRHANYKMYSTVKSNLHVLKKAEDVTNQTTYALRARCQKPDYGFLISDTRCIKPEI